MASTFNGLEVAKRALHTQQSALYTTGHNISNANTEGYTRQRVNMTQTGPYPPASRNRPEIPGQVGSGVEAGSIQRVRDSFIDKQYREENTKVGYYETKADMMTKLEAILNEPTEEGLSQSFDLFWQSLHDLSTNPEDSGARAVVKERANAVVDSLQYVHSSLEKVRANQKDEIGVNNSKINSLIDQINQVNEQISKIEPHGYVPNDLYDERDRLIDQLSTYADIKVDYRASSGQPSAIAQGIATITLAVDNSDVEQEGNDPVVLVDGGADVELGSSDAVNHLFTDFDNDNNLKAIFFANPTEGTTAESLADDYENQQFIYSDNFNVQGKLQALIDGAGYLTDFQYGGADDADYTSAGEINKIVTNIDTMVSQFITEFNAVHQDGYALKTDENGNPLQGEAFFTGTTADTIAVSDAILNDVDLIAASTTGATGDGENAIELANVYTKRVEEYLSYEEGDPAQLDDKATIKSYFESIIGEMGVVAEEANTMLNNSQILRQQVSESKQAISSVSLDEEMTNLIQFQHAYNAAARSMTVVDEMLDRIINSMGLVGR
ncbi:flagellar hook-associated protein FlgK [Gracilibacillus sp. S3-1-1]|uniref:Flagellar hook-associated protein FlgK n=1 Tax=Gracilibacillus pellucidus TaxID=3095368 RepID=A0ACC6M140_9BACI|nr:flagellar hook-associated protein FlgK [Gracilibacillus sp. S3-1-1]MDX8044597.1 flagellar hook-associated protein FlgK [Gracilibacillus sp. S3-1-1]